MMAQMPFVPSDFAEKTVPFGQAKAVEASNTNKVTVRPANAPIGVSCDRSPRCRLKSQSCARSDGGLVLLRGAAVQTALPAITSVLVRVQISVRHCGARNSQFLADSIVIFPPGSGSRGCGPFGKNIQPSSEFVYYKRTFIAVQRLETGWAIDTPSFRAGMSAAGFWRHSILQRIRLPRLCWHQFQCQSNSRCTNFAQLRYSRPVNRK